MSQMVLSVVAEVQPLSAAQLRDIAFQLREREETVPPGQQAFARWMTSIPVLHFLSMTVFDDDAYDPVFVIEANFDGAPGPFWAQLEAVIGTELREMLRCCKPPRDGRVALFEAVTRPGSRAPVAPLLEALTIRPIVFHQGNRGLDRARIADEAKVFFEVRQELDTGRYASLATAAGVHRALREKLVGRFPWLDEKAPGRVTAAENLADFLRFVGVGVGVVAVAVLLPVAIVLVPWLLWLERRDPATDAPKLEPKVMREMVEREDWLAQNHMTSVVHLKPGVVRAIVVRVGLRLLGLSTSRTGRSSATAAASCSTATSTGAGRATSTTSSRRRTAASRSRGRAGWGSRRRDSCSSTARRTGARSRRGRATRWRGASSGSRPTRATR